MNPNVGNSPFRNNKNKFATALNYNENGKRKGERKMKRKILKVCYLLIAIFSVFMASNVAMAAGTTLSTATPVNIGKAVSRSIYCSLKINNRTL